MTSTAVHTDASRAVVEAYLALRPTLVRAFAARLRSVEAAEDLVQELYVRAMRAGAVDDPKAWLFRAASNLLIDSRRGAMRSGARDDAWAREGRDEASPERAVEPSPERKVADRQVLARALEAVDALPPRMAEAFRLCRIQGLTQAEAARRMGVSAKVVEKHVAAALQRLTAEMKGIWP